MQIIIKQTNVYVPCAHHEPAQDELLQTIKLHSFINCMCVILLMIRGDSEHTKKTAVRLSGSEARSTYELKRQSKKSQNKLVSASQLESLITALR